MCLSTVAIIFLSVGYSSDECLTCENTNESAANIIEINTKAQPADRAGSLSHKASNKLVDNGITEKVELSAMTTNKASPPKKNYEDEWCFPDVELNESDNLYAQTQAEEWNRIIGKASFREDPFEFHMDERYFPNVNLMKPYEALPLEQLEALAFNDDKWAMVAFVQHSLADQGKKSEIAKRLLVQGASYYALKHLVRRSLVTAKLSYDEGSRRESAEHIKEAFIYAYWGLNNFSEGGFATFTALTAKEALFIELPVESLLTEAEQDLRERYEKLDKWILEERLALGIDVEHPSTAVERALEGQLAIRQHVSGEQVDFVKHLNITDTSPLKTPLCVDKYLAELRKTSQKLAK